jgi:hypothetical protein
MSAFELDAIKSQALKRLIQLYAEFASQERNLNSLFKAIRQKGFAKGTAYRYAHTIQILQEINKSPIQPNLSSLYMQPHLASEDKIKSIKCENCGKFVSVSKAQNYRKQRGDGSYKDHTVCQRCYRKIVPKKPERWIPSSGAHVFRL